MGAVTNSMLTLQHAAGGILAMVIEMLVETLLFIIRTSDLDGKKGKTKKSRHGSRYKKDQQNEWTMFCIWYSDDSDGIDHLVGHDPYFRKTIGLSCLIGDSEPKAAQCHQFLTLWKATPLMSSKNDTPFWHFQPPKWMFPPLIT